MMRNRFPLSLYVAGVVIVLAIINVINWFANGGLRARSVAIFSGGFLLGMFAMYIAVHLYKMSWAIDNGNTGSRR